jgi:hypothetical protein
VKCAVVCRLFATFPEQALICVQVIFQEVVGRGCDQEVECILQHPFWVDQKATHWEEPIQKHPHGFSTTQ